MWTDKVVKEIASLHREVFFGDDEDVMLNEFGTEHMTEMTVADVKRLGIKHEE